MVRPIRLTRSKFYHKLRLLLSLAIIVLSAATSMELFQLSTKNWRTVSVNGDTVLATTVTGERVPTTRAALGQVDMLFIEGIRDVIANSNGGYRHMSTAGGTGGTNFMMSSNDGVSSSSSSSAFSSSTLDSSNVVGSSGQLGTRRGEMSYNMRDTNNYSVSRTDLPFNWSRVFINDDLVTFVFKNGDVQMVPISSLEASQLEAVNKLKSEIAEMQRTQAQQFTNTMQNSMDMVSNVFNNIMGSFPRPPDYQSSVGNMFGNNFPFGSNNSPFSASAGWPFAGGAGAGAGAMAFASRR